MPQTDRAVILSGDLHNVGDLALLLQCADGVRHHCGIRAVQVRQWGKVAPDVRRQLDGAGIGVLAGKRPLAVLRATAGALVVIGGGQMARDNASIPSLASVAAGMAIARASGGRVAILGCGVDRLTRPVHRILWRAMMALADVVTVRDASAREAATALAGPRRAPALTADLMFAPSPVTAGCGPGDARIVIAPCEDASEGRSVVAAGMARMAVQACVATGVGRIQVIAQDSRPHGDVLIVRLIAGEVAALSPGLAVETVIGATLETVLRCYAASALTLTNRLHPAIFSLIAGRPVLILDDGTAKLRDAAERFVVARVASDADRIPAEVMAGLLAERADGPPPHRIAALAGASRAATANFTMLATATGLRGGSGTETDHDQIAAVQQKI